MRKSMRIGVVGGSGLIGDKVMTALHDVLLPHAAAHIADLLLADWLSRPLAQTNPMTA